MNRVMLSAMGIMTLTATHDWLMIVVRRKYPIMQTAHEILDALSRLYQGGPTQTMKVRIITY